MRMPHNGEREEVRMPFVPFSRAVRLESEVLDEALRPCSRFKSPLSWDERMDIRIAQLGAKMSSRKDAVLYGRRPLNWSALVRYLNAQGITDSTPIFIPSIRKMPQRTFGEAFSAQRHDGHGRARRRSGRIRQHVLTRKSPCRAQ